MINVASFCRAVLTDSFISSLPRSLHRIVIQLTLVGGEASLNETIISDRHVCETIFVFVGFLLSIQALVCSLSNGSRNLLVRDRLIILKRLCFRLRSTRLKVGRRVDCWQSGNETWSLLTTSGLQLNFRPELLRENSFWHFLMGVLKVKDVFLKAKACTVRVTQRLLVSYFSKTNFACPTRLWTRVSRPGSCEKRSLLMWCNCLFGQLTEDSGSHRVKGEANIWFQINIHVLVLRISFSITLLVP